MRTTKTVSPNHASIGVIYNVHILVHNSELAHVDCFVVSGSKVLEGVGRYVVVAVGQKSYNGRIMMGKLIFIIMNYPV